MSECQLDAEKSKTEKLVTELGQVGDPTTTADSSWEKRAVEGSPEQPSENKEGGKIKRSVPSLRPLIHRACHFRASHIPILATTVHPAIHRNLIFVIE
jgi:hypothetical protein